MSTASSIKALADELGFDIGSSTVELVRAWGNGPSGKFSRRYISTLDIIQNCGANPIAGQAIVANLRATASSPEPLLADLMPYVEGQAARATDDGERQYGVNIGNENVRGWLTALGADVNYALTSSDATELLALATEKTVWQDAGISENTIHDNHILEAISL